MLHVMLWEELVDRAYIEAHVEGFDALRAAVRDWTPQAAADVCGVKAEDIATAARWFATSAATLSLYCQGLNQSRERNRKNAALINLHLATGQIGKPGAGPFSLTGQPNAMGGREVGGLATSLAAHRSLARENDRAEMQRLWGVDTLPAKPGKTAVEMFEALGTGEIKAIWIACTNPAQSLPDLPSVRKALERAEFVVLQEAYRDTETAASPTCSFPPPAGARRTARSPTPSGASRACAPPCRPRARRATTGRSRSISRAGWRRGCVPASRRCLRSKARGGVWNEHRETTRDATSTSRDCPGRCSICAARSNGRSPTARARA